MVAASAEQGYHAVTVQEISRRARVSREAFYRLFPGKLECFLAAVEFGRALVRERFELATQALGGSDFQDVLRAMVHEHLGLCASEPEFTRIWVLDIVSAGPGTAALRNEILDEFTSAVRLLHQSLSPLRAAQFSDDYYIALIGGYVEVLFRRISVGETLDIASLEKQLTWFLLTALGETPRIGPSSGA